MTRDRQARMQKQRFDNIMAMRPDEVNAPPSVFRLVETMMSLAPLHRYQTPAQLLDAVRAARRDLEGKPGERNHTGPRSVFVAENDDRLQEAMREKFKQLGYRVFLAADPVRALVRFRQQPFDALVVDAGTIGEDGLLVFERVMSEASRQGVSCAGLLILNGEQSDWTKRIK